MIKVSHMLITVGALVISSVVTAEETKTGFSLTPFGNGFVLLNRETGVVSQCRKEEASDKLVCELASDDRQALEERIAQLEKKLSALPLSITKKQSDTTLENAPVGEAVAEESKPPATLTTTSAPEPKVETSKAAPVSAPKAPTTPSLRDQIANISVEAINRLFALADDLKTKL